MTIRNTTYRYGTIAITLHWLIAALFLVSYVTTYYRRWFLETQSDPWITLGIIHRCAGISVGAFVILRIVWRLSNPPPALPPGPKWEHAGAKLGHYALYFFMIAMPLTGYLGSDVATPFGGLFTVPNFHDTRLFQWISGGRLTFEAWEAPLDYFHRQIAGSLILWILIVVHVGAALYHHFYKRDDVLVRMLPMPAVQNPKVDR
jgi:cytochrome b561